MAKVPHGMGGTVLGTPSSHPTWLCPMCPSRPIVPHGMGGTVLGTPSSHPTWLCPMCLSRPIVPHGMGGTVLGTPIVPPYMALSHVSVPSHRPTWDGWDSPRDSHMSHHTWLVPCVRELLNVPLVLKLPSHCPTWDRRDSPRDSHVSHMGLEGLS